MFVSISLFAFLATATTWTGAARLAPVDDRLDLSTSDVRIVGGETVDIADYPYQLSILQPGNVRHCGASIISDNWALTAAHCVKGWKTEDLTIRAGSSRTDSGGTLFQISKVIYHELWQTNPAKLFDHDIAVVQIKGSFPLGTSGVKKITLAGAGTKPTAGVKARVSGFGLIKRAADTHPLLQAVTVPMLAQEHCEKIYPEHFTDNMICASNLEGGKCFCIGDSGGPLVIDNIQVGVVSWTMPCAVPGYAGVYACVGTFRNWIREQTGI